ncbi:MAG: hypothetical protein KAQ68_08785 [Clostridiales bacterium]|nr:hypothetical protein [Clostridiales bacterium]
MFNRYKSNPVISKTPNTFHSMHVANPDVLEYRDKILMYFRGQGEECHDQIGVAYCKADEFDGVNWDFYDRNPIIKVSENKDDYDTNHILDPATVVIKDKVYLYYSGHSYDKPSIIGLAISNDGYNFMKHKTPIIDNAFAPEVVIRDGMVYLFYQKKSSPTQDGYYEFYVCKSQDGIHFDESTEELIFSPTKKTGAFDEFSVSTARIWYETNQYYMVYGGCNQYSDYPLGFGLATSDDLIHWRRYENNPILLRGEIGTWDEGALWFGTVFKHNDTYYLYYEGTGAGLGTESKEARDTSEIVRNQDYGGYARFNFSQIGLAIYKGKLPNIKKL